MYLTFIPIEYHLTPLQWSLIIMASMITGMSKAGVGPISIISVAIWAWIFGSRPSTGILLPMLIVADICAVYYYKRHAVWPILIKLIPWIAIGVILAAWFGHRIDDQLFKRMMAGIILLSVGALFYWEKKPLARIPSHWAVSSVMGLATGFTSMIGNLAGGFSNIYFISMRVLKDNFIGTAAWMFFLLNLFKLPFHIWVWKTVTPETLSLNLILVPGILLGFWLGVKIVANLNERRFKNLILWLTAISSLLVLLDL